jgi:hypothetical protein
MLVMLCYDMMYMRRSIVSETREASIVADPAVVAMLGDMGY